MKKRLLALGLAGAMLGTAGCTSSKNENGEPSRISISQEYSNVENYYKYVMQNGKAVKLYNSQNVYLLYDKKTYEVNEYIFQNQVRWFGGAELYDLECLAHSVQDKGNNYTRFICISKKLEIYPGSDKTSIMMILPHKPGALYKILSRFYAVGINLEKLESRPLPDRDFEFMFYFDLNTSIYSEQYAQIINELDELCEEYKYLGSYLEIV
jgi:hypothetical protein